MVPCQHSCHQSWCVEVIDLPCVEFDVEKTECNGHQKICIVLSPRLKPKPCNINPKVKGAQITRHTFSKRRADGGHGSLRSLRPVLPTNVGQMLLVIVQLADGWRTQMVEAVEEFSIGVC